MAGINVVYINSKVRQHLLELLHLICIHTIILPSVSLPRYMRGYRCEFLSFCVQNISWNRLGEHRLEIRPVFLYTGVFEGIVVDGEKVSLGVSVPCPVL